MVTRNLSRSIRLHILVQLVTRTARYRSRYSLSHSAAIYLPTKGAIHLVKGDETATAITNGDADVNSETLSSPNSGVYDLSRL